MSKKENVFHSGAWGVYTFPWGTAVKKEGTSHWSNVCIKGTVVDVDDMNVILYENGIEFC